MGVIAAITYPYKAPHYQIDGALTPRSARERDSHGGSPMTQTITFREIGKLLDISVQSATSLMEHKKVVALRKDGIADNSAWLIDRRSFCTRYRSVC